MNIFYRRIEILSRSFGTKFFLLMLIGVLTSSCNESSILGLDVQPQGDLLNVGAIDTATIISKTVREDSLHTDNSILTAGDALIGTYMDPVFGNVSSSLYTQLRLPTSNPTFGNSLVCDSVVLSLAYAPGFYGKKGRLPQNINVYQLDASLSGTYYSNNTVAYNAANDLAGNHSFTPRPTDSVDVSGKRLKPHLRVPIQTSFGQNILDNQGNLSFLGNNTAFQSVIKGLYLTTENTLFTAGSGDGNIMHFKMEDAQTKLSIYYHRTIQTAITHVDSIDYKSYDIGLGSVTRFSHFKHDFTSGYSYLQSQLNGTSTIDTTVFIQALAGTKAKIEFPYLKNLNDSGKIAINKAELVIKTDETNSLYQLDTFATPSKLILFGVNTSGLNYVIPDSYESNETFDGAYDKIKHEYHFNIERYIQQVLNGKLANTGLYVIVSGGAVTASRVVIGGGKNLGSQKMKLNLTYTKLH